MKSIDNEPENSESSAENGAESYNTGESLAPNDSESSAENGAESYDTGEALAPNDNPEQPTEAQRIEHARDTLGITRLTEHVRMICDHFHLPHTL